MSNMYVDVLVMQPADSVIDPYNMYLIIRQVISSLCGATHISTRRRSESAYIRQVNFVRNNGP